MKLLSQVSKISLAILAAILIQGWAHNEAQDYVKLINQFRAPLSYSFLTVTIIFCILYISGKYSTAAWRKKDRQNDSISPVPANIYLHEINELKQKLNSFEKSNKELREYLNYLQKTHEDERQSLAQELNNKFCQKLILLKLNLNQLIKSTPGCECLSGYQECMLLAAQLTHELKDILHSLKPAMLEEMGLGPALVALVKNTERQYNIMGNIDLIDINGRLDRYLEITIFRIVQEALNNIARYSRAYEFSVQLIRMAGSIRVLVSDDGYGFGSENSGNKAFMGIRNMQERTRSYNGVFKINSSPEDGTVIMADFPLEEHEDA